jgi:hypothetical protein
VDVWQFLCQTQLSNRVFESYDAIVDACCGAWNALINDPARITSIATRDWAPVTSQARWSQIKPSLRPRSRYIATCARI